MKYKYPKKITIGDTVFHIKYNWKKDNGARFKYPTEGKKARIEFDMLNHKTSPLQFLNFLIHEFKEIIQIEQCTRFYNRGHANYEFHYDHIQHSDMCCRLTELLTHFIK